MEYEEMILGRQRSSSQRSQNHPQHHHVQDMVKHERKDPEEEYFRLVIPRLLSKLNRLYYL